jgi:hypothetical protein
MRPLLKGGETLSELLLRLPFTFTKSQKKEKWKGIEYFSAKSHNGKRIHKARNYGNLKPWDQKLCMLSVAEQLSSKPNPL